MGNYLSPGIYTREIDFSFYVKQISTSSCGMVGVAERGPINKPVLVTSWEQFVNKFGGYIPSGYLAYAARAFFDNGGSVLYVNRIAYLADPLDRNSLTAAKASIQIKDRTQTAQDILKIEAIDEGKWGDRLSVTIEDTEDVSPKTFNLTVRYEGSMVEIFKNLSMDESKDNHIELVINQKSDFISVDDLDSGSDALPEAGVFELTGGTDGLDSLNDGDFIGDPSQHTGLYAFDEIDALNILAVPGVTTAALINAGITYAESRKDLIFLADIPIHLEPLEAVDFRKGQGMYTHAAFNSSYAALYYPWLEIKDPMTSKNKLIPPSGAVAGCYARNDKKANVWDAPAGIDRGRIFNALSVSYKTSRGERDVLYPEGVNVIAVFPDTGINIWGQKTLQSQPSATDRVNVRRLMMFMEEAISKSSRFVVFQPSNPQTWRALIRLINPFLQDIKENGGLYDFALQCDEETNTPVVIDRNEIITRIFVKPTKTAEFVELNFVMTDTGADFKEVFRTT